MTAVKIEFQNIPEGGSKFGFLLRLGFNVLRSFLLFRVRYPWVKTSGFVRVMKGTSFARKSISLGKNVQFGHYCNVATHATIGNSVLFAGRVCLVGKNDHEFRIPGETIWAGARGVDEEIFIGNDVWVGTGAIILGGTRVGHGCVIAAGSVVNRDVPDCEIWGGVPAKKISDRFSSSEEKDYHLQQLKVLFN